MDAVGLLESIAKIFADERLEVVLIGGAAAAIEGAPVTTDDFDFMFRPTRGNLAKMKVVAERLGANVSQPEYPVSKFYRIMNREAGLQVDLMGVVDGVKSFESLRSRASQVFFGGAPLLVASLRDIIKSKRQAGRDKDRMALPVLEETLRFKEELSGRGGDK
jgi:hypothetical protein